MELGREGDQGARQAALHEEGNSYTTKELGFRGIN